jgi:hypothetical protein
VEAALDSAEPGVSSFYILGTGRQISQLSFVITFELQDIPPGLVHVNIHVHSNMRNLSDPWHYTLHTLPLRLLASAEGSG